MKLFIKRVLRRLGLQTIRKDYSILNLYDKYLEEDLRNKCFINIGAGSFNHVYWTNVDYESDHYKKLQTDFVNYDLMSLSSLTFNDNSVCLAYSSHTIEHVTDEAVQNLFDEVYRVLKPNAGFRVTAPCANLAFNAYKSNDIEFFYWRHWQSNNNGGTFLKKWSIESLFVHHFATELVTRKVGGSEVDTDKLLHCVNCVEDIESITSLCSFNPDNPGYHINWWNEDKVMEMLIASGFSQVYVSGFGKSRFAPMRDVELFDSTHPTISFYVEAVK